MKSFILFILTLLFCFQNLQAQYKIGLENTQGVARFELRPDLTKNVYSNNNFVILEKILKNEKTSVKVKFLNSYYLFTSNNNNVETTSKLKHNGFLLGFKQQLPVVANVDIATEFNIGLSWFKNKTEILFDNTSKSIDKNPNLFFPFFISGNYTILNDFTITLGLSYELLSPLANDKGFKKSSTTGVLLGVSFKIPNKSGNEDFTHNM